MKIRLTCDVWLPKDIGLVKGRTLEVLRPAPRVGLRKLCSAGGVYVEGDDGHVWTVWPYEYEVVDDD